MHHQLEVFLGTMVNRILKNGIQRILTDMIEGRVEAKQKKTVNQG